MELTQVCGLPSSDEPKKALFQANRAAQRLPEADIALAGVRNRRLGLGGQRGEQEEGGFRTKAQKGAWLGFLTLGAPS